MRCPGCQGTCTCQIVARDGTVESVPTPNGVAMGVRLAPNAGVGLGGDQLLEARPEGLFFGSERLPAAGGGGSGLTNLQSGNGAGGWSSASALTWRIHQDGYRGFEEGFTEPRVAVLGDGARVLVIPDQGVASMGRGGATNLAGGSPMWVTNLPRQGEAAVTIPMGVGEFTQVPPAQTRTALAVLSIEIAQRLPDPATVSYASKTAAWYIDWGVELSIGSAVVGLVNNVLRFEPQPMSRNIHTETFIGRVMLPAGSNSAQLKFTPNTDQLPTSPAITVAVAGWSLGILY